MGLHSYSIKEIRLELYFVLRYLRSFDEKYSSAVDLGLNLTVFHLMLYSPVFFRIFFPKTSKAAIIQVIDDDLF